MGAFQLSILDNMTKPTQTTLATAGILHLRGILAVNVFPDNQREALTALCDYAQAQIEARARGGKTVTDARIAANKRNAQKSRKARKPKCNCGAMTAERAAKRNHIC